MSVITLEDAANRMISMMEDGTADRFECSNCRRAFETPDPDAAWLFAEHVRYDHLSAGALLAVKLTPIHFD